MDKTLLIVRTIGIGIGISISLLLIPYLVKIAGWIVSYGFVGLSIGLGVCIAMLYFVINIAKDVFLGDVEE